MKRVDEVWKGDEQVRLFLEGLMGAIPFFDAQIETMMSLIEGQSVTSFLDLGCGDGILSRAILSRYPSARGVLLDFSSPMLKKAREAFAGQAASLKFVRADFAVPDWPSKAGGATAKTFDVIVSGYAIHHQRAEVKRSIFKVIFELLSPGGYFINIDHVASPTKNIMDISNNIFIEHLKAYHESQGGPADFEKVRDIFLERMAEEAGVLSTLDSQIRWLGECGFIEVDCFFKYFELAVFGGRKPGMQPVNCVKS